MATLADAQPLMKKVFMKGKKKRKYSKEAVMKAMAEARGGY